MNTTKYTAEFRVHRLRELPAKFSRCDTPRVAYRYWRRVIETAQWYDPERENLCVISLDSQLNAMGFHLVSIGLVNCCSCHAREVYRTAIVANATAIIMAHNHPSGDPTPSNDDVSTTAKLVNAGKMIGIPLVDHIIIGKPSNENSDGFLSLKQYGAFLNC